MTDEEQKLELLAAYAHETWAGWMSYMFGRVDTGSLGYVLKHGMTIPPGRVFRWTRQIVTAYDDLPEDEKESDRAEARKMLAIMVEADEDRAVDGAE